MRDARGVGAAVAARIICIFANAGTVMEAERLNAVANRIADLSGRSEQLRRYL
jgi:hypothetical protein